MNTRQKVILGSTVGLVIIAVALGFIYGVFPQAALSSTFTPVYCNNYEFTCCAASDSLIQRTMTIDTPYICPNTGLGCKVTNVLSEGHPTIYVGHGNCASKTAVLGLIKYFECDVEQTYSVSGATDINIPKGYYLYPNRLAQGFTVSISEQDQKLVFTGRAGSTTGVPIKVGSCVFDVGEGNKLTDIQGNLLSSGLSYTIPKDSCALSWQSGDRFVCGNLEEQCGADADCGGHTFGTQECYARTLQTYGCVQKAAPSNLVKTAQGYLDPALNKNRLPDTFYNGALSRCEIKTAKTVQCCGDTDCGSNAFCDKTDFTCKAKVECSKNTDCGVSTQCDYSTKQLKTPVCTSKGTCGYDAKVVGCCADANCPNGQYCGQDNTCAAKTPVDLACPYECCQSDAGYLDKGCAAGLFCAKNSCSTTPECSKDADCAKDEMCKDSACVATATACVPQWGGLIPAAIGVKEDCGFFCAIGLKSPEKVDVCVYDHTPLVLITLVIVFVLGLAVYAKSKSGGGRKAQGAAPDWLVGSEGLLRSKGFWLGIAVLVGVALIVGYFQYLFWAVAGLFGLAVLYVIVRIFVFKKIW